MQSVLLRVVWRMWESMFCINLLGFMQAKWSGSILSGMEEQKECLMINKGCGRGYFWPDVIIFLMMTILQNWHVHSLVLIRLQKQWSKVSGASSSNSDKIHSDQGEHFEMKLISGLLRLSGVKKYQTTPTIPWLWIILPSCSINKEKTMGLKLNLVEHQTLPWHA